MTELVRVIASSGLRLRDAPRDGATMRILPSGEQIEVLGRETWLRVRHGDQIGYVLSDHVESLAAPVTTVPPNILSLPDSPAGMQFTGNVNIVEYSGKFRGATIRVDEEFLPDLQRIEKEAGKQQLEIFITSSLREPTKPVAGAVVAPARFSNHHVGHAIDMNVVMNGQFFRSTDLARFSALPPQIQAFLNTLRNATNNLRWGNDFSTPDPVHLDNGLNIRHSEIFKKKIANLWGVNS